MAKILKQDSKNYLYIAGIVIMFIIIIILTYLIFNTLKTKTKQSESYKLLKIIENFTFQISNTPGLTDYVELEKNFRLDYNKQLDDFNNSYANASASVTKFNTDFTSNKTNIDSLQKQLDNANNQIGIINTQLNDDNADVAVIKKSVDDLVLNLTKLQADTNNSLNFISDNLQNDFKNALNDATTSLNNAKILNDTIIQGKQIQSNFDQNFGKILNDKISTSKSFLSDMKEKIKELKPDTNEQTLLQNALNRLNNKIDQLSNLFKDIESKLDHSKKITINIENMIKYITQQQQKLNDSDVTLKDINLQVNGIIDQTKTLITDLGYVGNTLGSIQDINTSIDDLSKFTVSIDNLPPISNATIAPVPII